jgi:hypothetical protein
MGTVKPPGVKSIRAAERDPQVYHPLDRLRGIIRRYVVIEGVLSAVLFVAVWFAAGLVLDFGAFKLFGWDWALDGAWGLRCLALLVAVGLFGGILVFRIARRVTKEFSYPALALVLERKFPTVLGDRLITAVEMADVEAMGKFGYSPDMIRATIAEARERVAGVPVREVFNWKRLWVLGLLAVGLLLGTVAFSYASYAVATGSGDVYRFGWKFAHVTGIFAERNVALMDTPWPRRAHLELVAFPDDELTIGRDAPPPRVTARAYRWVIADRAAPEGWRPLVWTDVTEQLVDRPVPVIPPAVLAMTPRDAREEPEPRDSISVDHLERVLAETDETASPELVKFRGSVRTALNSAAGPAAPPTQDYEALQEVFKALARRADEPSMGRTLRRLDIPGEVTYKYSGRRTAGGGSLTPQQNNEYAGEIAGLKEDVEFVVRAEDYTSPPRMIRLIPPPSLKRLSRDQSEPAYLHHEPPAGEGYEALKGRLQKVSAKDLSLTGDRTVFAVPAGSEVVLTAEAYTSDDGAIDPNDRIASASAIPVSGRFPGTVLDDKGKPTQTPVPLEIYGGGQGFKVAFQRGAKDPKDPQKNTDFRLLDNVEFKVTWVNKYNVSATRTILVQVVQDQPPVVEVAADVIRKVGNVYLVTPAARIPFNPESFIKDDHGLSKVEYTFAYWAEDSDLIRGLRTKYALRALLDVPLPGGGPARLLPRVHADNFRFLDKSDDRRTGSVFVSEFENQRRQLPQNTRDTLEQLLATAKSAETGPETVKKIELKNPSRDYFDLKELHDRNPPILTIAVPRGEVQTIYRMDLNVQATDNNVDSETGPVVTRNAEPIRLRIVSESDLLVEISREELLLAERLDEALAKLAAAKEKYKFVYASNNNKPETPPDVDPVKVRAQDALQDVEKARDVVQSVGREFHRLARECEVNRVVDATQKQYNRFVTSYDALLSDRSTQFPKTFPQAQELLVNVQNALNLGRWAQSADVTDAAGAILALENAVKFLKEQHGENGSQERVRNLLKKVKRDQERIDNEIVELRRYAEGILRDPNPTILEAGVVSFSKGETKRLDHAISWNQFQGDTLVVKVTASDPSITVPAELTLDYEKNTTRFDYEVKAGNKEGTFKIKLTPAVGKPVETQIIVK